MLQGRREGGERKRGRQNERKGMWFSSHSAMDLLAWATALLQAIVCFTGMSMAEP